MRLEQSFSVQAPPDMVFETLTDVRRVAPCLPGADITDQQDDGSFKGTFTVKLGPTTASYLGTLRIQERDDDARRAVMDAKGTDKRGGGGTTATIISVVEPDGDGSRVSVDTDYAITGKLARFGRSGMVEDISKRLLREFSQNLEAQLAAQGAASQQPAETTGPVTGTVAPPGAPAHTGGGPAPLPPAAKPVSGLMLVLGAFWDRVARLFGRRNRRF
jgi:carbon monoxide dehydrogenase subunit G